MISTDNGSYDLNSNFLEEVWVYFHVKYNSACFSNKQWLTSKNFLYFLSSIILPPIVVLNKAAVVSWCMLYFGKKKYFRGNHFSLNFLRKLTFFTPSSLPIQITNLTGRSATFLTYDYWGSTLFFFIIYVKGWKMCIEFLLDVAIDLNCVC